MNILVINSGSSTVKFQVIETTDATGDLLRQQKLARGLVDRIGAGASYRFEGLGRSTQSGSLPVGNHEEAVRSIIHWLRSDGHDLALDAVGHRVVHGGDEFLGPVRIDDGVISKIEALNELAPLHNPAALSGIRAAQKILGAAVPMVAVFDTSFHHTIPEQAATYAIPYELSQKHKISRYGFHGLAHQYDIARYADLNGKPVAQVRAVTLHLGNGCSATAIRNGQAVDTSMGFTPLEGLVMGTRSGDLDPALVNYLARKESVTAVDIEDMLNKRSGLLGLSGLSNDMRELTAAYDKNPRARLAVDVFCHRARKYLGAYLAVLGGAEAVIFSGGIGENSPLVREKICAGMEWCGLTLDPSANATVIGTDSRISAPDSTLDVWVIHTDEENIIARETARVLQRR
ncbi:MAG: acetate kinase [Deltaproteobacteria bacterium]|nr:acetate kinase [Deltaproteobacteria bacterium]MDZ4346845.1 acetate kinase [Candidatus Binatia bacterium]